MNVLKEIDGRIKGWLSPDRKPHDNWTIPRSPAEMRTWRDLPDPKPTYQEYVGIPVDEKPGKREEPKQEEPNPPDDFLIDMSSGSGVLRRKTDAEREQDERSKIAKRGGGGQGPVEEDELPSKSAEEAAEAMKELADKSLSKEEIENAVQATIELTKAKEE